MAIYYNVFGKSCLNPFGDIHFVAMNEDGTIHTFEFKPHYVDGFWVDDQGGDHCYDNSEIDFIGAQLGVDVSKCLWDIDFVATNGISLENYLESSLVEKQS